MTFKFREFRDSTPLLNDTEALKTQALKDGYLYFPQLVNRQSVLSAREDILSLCQEFGWLADDAPRSAGVVRNQIKIMESPSQEWEAFYKKIICLHSLTQLAFDEGIIDALKPLIGDDVLPHCRKVCRLYSPTAGEYATPPHKDYTWTGGAINTWTAWLPLGDLDFDLGGLQVIAGSHQGKFEPKNGDERQGWIIPDGTVWDFNPSFKMGDVVLFSGDVLHSGRNNVSKDKIRISADFRYQSASEPIRSDSLCAHWNEKFNMSWDTIYAGWPEDSPHKYYWKKFSSVVAESEGTFRQDVKRRYILHSIMSAFNKDQDHS